ncbi:hypothetical protein [Rhodococcus opacus]|uniref:hypothetical protein n=1 Tax=Rhodococcus opacus TaxID=37919 RepID=UPI000EAA4304|nr:hypothetical protein [Rhodococcus opacus]QZS56053.1 hypothetical protein FXW36_39360 [Rhodococcus opacus]RKM70874.1 hypothetical protein COO55_01555 [Rhodococcus opacus]
MQGHSKELQAAAARFAEALPITSELAVVADEVLTEIQAEIDATDAEIERFGREQPLTEPGTEMAIAFRRGAHRALLADRSRWRKIVNTLREIPDRPIDPSGTAYIAGDRGNGPNGNRTT